MTSEDLRKLIIDTGITLNLEPRQITLLDVAINLAYNQGWMDRASYDKKTITEIALENGASVDDMPVK